MFQAHFSAKVNQDHPQDEVDTTHKSSIEYGVMSTYVSHVRYFEHVCYTFHSNTEDAGVPYYFHRNSIPNSLKVVPPSYKWI
jgi:hypothetical protein